MNDTPDHAQGGRKIRVRIFGWLVVAALTLSGATWEARWVAIRVPCAIAFVYALWQVVLLLRQTREPTRP